MNPLLAMLVVGCVDPVKPPPDTAGDTAEGDTADPCDDGAVEVPGNGADEDCDGTDGQALIYVVERYDGIFWVIDRATGAAVSSIPDMRAMVGVAPAPDGTVFVSRTDGMLSLVDPVAGTFSDVIAREGATLGYPQGLWYDASTATVLVADVVKNQVFEVDPLTATVTVIADVSEPEDVLRRPGQTTFWVTSRSDHALYRVDGPGATPVAVASITDAHSIAPGRDGVLYVMGTGDRVVYGVDEATGAMSTVAADFAAAGPVGLCVDPSAEGLLLTDHGGGTVFAHDLATGTTAAWSTAVNVPFECGSNVPFDADGDGELGWSHGGGDCDDADPSRTTGC